MPGFWEIYPKHIAFSAAFRSNREKEIKERGYDYSL